MSWGRKCDQCGEIGHFKVVSERGVPKFSAVGIDQVSIAGVGKLSQR